jgi:hypothetical protein
VLVVILLLLIIYILGGVRIDEKLMTNLYIYKVVCNPLLINPQIYKLLSCVPLSQPFIWGLSLRVSYMSHQKRDSYPVCKKWKDFIFYLSVLFKNTLKNSIEIHKNFIEPNSEKFKNNFENIQY